MTVGRAHIKGESEVGMNIESRLKMLSVGHLQLLVPRLLKHKNLKVHFYDFNSINIFYLFFN